MINTFILIKHTNNLVIKTLTLHEIRTMDVRLFKLFGNGRYVKVSEWQREPRVDLRQHELCDGKEVPRKKGTSRRMIQFKTLLSMMDSVEESIHKNGAQSWYLGYNAYVHVRENNPCVDIRQYWNPTKESDITPTKKGLCLRPFELHAFKDLLAEIENCLPELKDVQCSSERDDHQNQLGMLQCKIWLYKLVRK